MRQPSWAATFVSCNAKAWKFKRSLLQKEEPCWAKTLWNVKVLWGLLSDGTETSEGKIIFNFRIWWYHMKTENNLGTDHLKCDWGAGDGKKSKKNKSSWAKKKWRKNSSRVNCTIWLTNCTCLEAGLKKYLNSTLPVGQVTLKFCLPVTLPSLPKFSNSFIINEPKNGSQTTGVF